MTKPLGMGVTQSNNISSARMKNKPRTSHIWRATLNYILIYWTNKKNLINEKKWKNCYDRKISHYIMLL